MVAALAVVLCSALVLISCGGTGTDLLTYKGNGGVREGGTEPPPPKNEDNGRRRDEGDHGEEDGKYREEGERGEERGEGGYGEEEDIVGRHNQGMQCISCHSFGGGTVFTKLKAADNDVNSAAVYHTVVLLFEDGSSLRAPRGKGSGNFQIPAGLRGKFTATVVDASGRVVNSSLQLSHTQDRYNCNACHTQSGASGAPGRIVNYNLYGGK